MEFRRVLFRSVVSAKDQLNLDIANGEITDSYSSLDVTYIFSGADNVTPPASLTFECSLDSASFTSCFSPKTYPGLPLGLHNFQVRAKDAVNNTDSTPASHAFTISDDKIASSIDTRPTKMPSALGGCGTDGNALTSNYANCVGQTSFTAGGKTFGESQTFGSIQVTDAANPADGLLVISTVTDSIFKICFNQMLAKPKANQILSCGSSLKAVADSNNEGDSVIIHGAPLKGPNTEDLSSYPAIRVYEPPGQTVTVDAPNGMHTISTPASNTANLTTEILQERGTSNSDIYQLALYNIVQQPGVDVELSQNPDGSTNVSNSQTSRGNVTVNGANGQLILTPGQSAIVDTYGRLDLDNDGVYEDNCPNTPGKPEWQGCPFADKNIVELHIVGLGKGPSTKSPLSGVEVRVFDRNIPDFQAIAGSKNPKGDLYGIIYEADSGRVGSCVTGSDGICFAGEENKGDYLVIIKWNDLETAKTVYVGRPKSPEDFKDNLATKEFQIVKAIKKDGTIEYRGGSKVVVAGSLLEVIVPESAVWEGNSSIYPFIFTSDSDWTVDVCAEVPAGYSIVGVYDENGNLTASSQCMETFVANTSKTIAFEVKETGSPEPSFSANLKLKNPKGKITQQTHKVSDVRRGTFNNKVKEAKIKVEGLKRLKKPASLSPGSSLWHLTADVLDSLVSNGEMKEAVKILAQYNKIDIPEWGVNNGGKDARRLLAGSLIDLTPLGVYLRRME